METKKVGLMGCGAVARYGHLPSIVATEGLELHAVYDPVAASAEEAKEKYGAHAAFSSVEEFLCSGIEAVTLTSPAPFHRDNVLACAQHRLPVLCEKPLAMNEAEGGEMIAAMARAEVPLHTAFCYRYSPVALKIRELVSEGAIGTIGSLRLIYNWGLHGKYSDGPDGTKGLNLRREGRMLEGGPMVDCGTHQIDLASFWLQSPVVHYSGHGAWVDEYEAPDHMWLHLDHANGAHTMVEMSYSYHHTTRERGSEFVYELIGSKGVIRYSREEKKFQMENETGAHTFPFSEEKSFKGLYREWAKALRGEEHLLATAEQGLTVAHIARTVTQAAIHARRQDAVSLGL